MQNGVATTRWLSGLSPFSDDVGNFSYDFFTITHNEEIYEVS
jgi:hypothetical protein